MINGQIGVIEGARERVRGREREKNWKGLEVDGMGRRDKERGQE